MATDVRPVDGTLKVNGLQLHYLEWRDKSAPGMLLLHGLTSHAHSWDRFARAFCDRYHIIALDQRGHGDSEWPADHAYNTSDYVADALGVADTLGLDRFVLIGLSMGAHNAMAFTADHPERVARLVSIDIPPALGSAAERRARSANVQPPPRIFTSVEEAYQSARALNPRPPEDVQRDRVRTGLKQLPDGRFELKYDPAAPQYWEPANLRDVLATIPCPTLIIRGGESDVLPADVAEAMTAAFPNACLVTIAGSGHPVPLDRPTDFEQAVHDFLSNG